MVKVLIVDDSLFVRRSLSTLLERDAEIQVVGCAANGEEAVDMVNKFDPDVVTMDVEMPRMNGLAALQRIMAEKPCPVIMISSLTSDGAEVTLKALELGALDFMPKLTSGSLPDMAKVETELCAKVKTLARRKAFMRLVHSRKNAEARPPAMPAASPSFSAAPPRPQPAPGVAPRPRGTCLFDAVAIGVSTGGPPAVHKVLSVLPQDFPVPILIAQHMPAAFTGPFAKRLDGQCAVSVKEAQESERLQPGTVYICPGGKHLRLESRGTGLFGMVTEDPKDALYKPSANVLMETAGTALGKRALGVMLTGMGNDGLEGTKVLKAKGGRVIAQSEASCVVYGMPKAIVDANLADQIVDIDAMAAAILENLGR